MSGATIVTVVVDGRIVEGSIPATLRRDAVVAPLSPYFERIAERIERDRSDTSVTFERAGRTIRITVVASPPRSGNAPQSNTIAPYLRAGEAIIPLATVARALGDSVAYDAATRTLQIDTNAAPLSTMTPYAAWSPPAVGVPTFTPTPTPGPSAMVTGIPLPRRTPIPVDAEHH